MIIPNEAYVVFYEALKVKFSLLIPATKSSKPETIKFKIWEKVNPDGEKKKDGTRSTYFETYFHKYSKIGYKHFYNKYKAALSGIKKEKKNLPLTKYEIHQFERSLSHRFITRFLKNFIPF